MNPECTLPLPPRTIFQYAKADWIKLEDFYMHYPWRVVLSWDNVNDVVASLTDAINVGMKLCIPTVQLCNKTEKIFSANARKELAKKRAAYKHYNAVRAHNPRNSPAVREARIKLRSVSNLCKKVINSENFRFLKAKTDKVLDHPNDPRFYYHTVRSLQRNFSKPSMPPLNNDGITISDPREKCNHLASIFAMNSTIPNPQFSPFPLHKTRHIMKPIVFRCNVIRKYLLELNPHKAAGPDGIPALILKRYANIFAPILTKIFVLSHKSGVYPEAWKIANVQPIPKKGDKADAKNYRPISIISVLSKVFEKYINWYILNYLEKANIISDKQYGFRKKRSTCDLLTMLIHDWNKSLEKNSESYVISLDVAKAFDTVWHENLILKTEMYGFDTALIALLRSFLFKRRMAVVLDGYKSKLFELNAGVPQGSPLASTLFLIYINDLLFSTTNSIHSYADDTTLHATVPSIDSSDRTALQQNRKIVIDSLNTDLQLILHWGERNLVKFNSEKTQLCVMSRKKIECELPILMNNIALPKRESIRLLGVNASSNLLWNEHITDIAKSTVQKLGFLARCRKFFSSAQTLQIYKSMIRPCIEYCSPVWGGASVTQLAVLDAVQRRAVRIINDPIITESMQSLQHRRNVADLSLFYKYYFGDCSEELKTQVPARKRFTRCTRGAASSHMHTVVENKCRTMHFQNDYFSRSAHCWNKVPEHIFQCNNLNDFKRNIHRHLQLNEPIRISH